MDAILHRSIAILVLLLAIASDAKSGEILQAEGDLRWYRGNMHTHSLWSDGDDYLEMIGLWYRDHDYQFLVFTDHNVLAKRQRWIDVEKSKGKRLAFDKLKSQFPNIVQQRINQAGRLEARLSTFAEVSNLLNRPGKFLLIQGEEISDRFEKHLIHMNVSNVDTVIPPMKGSSVFDTIQNNVRAAHAQRRQTGQAMIIHLNHPNFVYSVSAEDLMRVRGERFFEIYNGHPAVNNRGDESHVSTERIWDIVLTRRLAELQLPMMFGLATDDGHSYHKIPNRESNPGRGWVMVLAKQLSAESLIEALEAGKFYSSSGVTLSRVESSPDGLSVEVEPVKGEEYTIEFIGTRIGYDATSKPVLDERGQEIYATRIYSNDIGQTLAVVKGNRAAYRFAGDEIYVRARITSSAKHPNPSDLGDWKKAWCQPVLGPGLVGE